MFSGFRVYVEAMLGPSHLFLIVQVQVAGKKRGEVVVYIGGRGRV